jgi:hypothetical protein
MFFGKALAQGTEIESPLPEVNSIPDLILKIADFLFTLAIYILPIVIVGGGLFWITSAGNPEQAEKGKKIITYSLIGFVIIILAKGLIKLLQNSLGMTQ